LQAGKNKNQIRQREKTSRRSTRQKIVGRKKMAAKKKKIKLQAIK